MRKIHIAVVCAGLLTAMHIGPGSMLTLADAATGAQYGQTQSGQELRPRLTERQIQQILTRIRTNTAALRASLEPAAPAGRGRGRGRANRGATDVEYLVDDLVAAANHLDDHIIRRQAVRIDVEDLLTRSALVDVALQQSSQSAQPQQARTVWARIRRDVDGLASAYNMPLDWANPSYTSTSAATTGELYRRVAGTYRLDPARSDDPRRMADTVLRQVPASARPRVTRQLSGRLQPPDVIAIERVDRQVTIASSRAAQITFTADGQPRSEQGAAGRTATTRATLYGDAVEVTTTGTAGSDFTVTFEPLDNGQSLRVTRRLYDDSLGQPIVVNSVYRRTATTPDWTVYDESAPVGTIGRGADLIIPDGMTFVATLDQPLNTRTAQPNDRVSLTVRQGAQSAYDTAVIEGYVVSAPERTGGRTALSIGFDEIRLRDGRTARFDGTIEAVRGPNGETIRFDGGDVTRDESTRDQALQRGAIGAALGALLGAIAGGGKGAAVGAVLGGGGAAATVFIDNPNQLSLPRGTEFTIRSRSAELKR